MLLQGGLPTSYRVRTAGSSNFDKQDPPSIFWTGKILNLFETALDWTVEVLLYILLHINLEDIKKEYAPVLGWVAHKKP